MRPQWGRLIRRTTFVGVSLAVIGYALAQGFLLVQRMYGGGAYLEENERVLWQTPLVMALLGMALCGALELAIGVCRKPAPATATARPKAN
ncbi:MAG TPA: hypothetical protein VM597_30555 [Gemmataceae bacterium]|jgi:hypothetical protein|nr:hypothetical protein [Gemmataceae bacterium]